MAIAREYAITGENERFINEEDKKHLINEMLQITKANPQLIIICGIAVKRENVSSIDKEKILAAYDLVSTNGEDSEIKSYKKVLQANAAGITEISNEVLIFDGEKVQVLTKLKPFFEASTLKKFNNQRELANTFLPNTYLNPFNNTENNSTLFETTHQGKKIKFVVEDCLDHVWGRFKKEAKLRQSFNFFGSITESIPLQIAVGDGVKPTLANIEADNFVLVDSRVKSQIISKSKPGKLPIRLYQISLTNPDAATLKGPLQSLHSQHFVWLEKMLALEEKINSAENVFCRAAKLPALKKILNYYQTGLITNSISTNTFIKDVESSKEYEQIVLIKFSSADFEIAAEFIHLLKTIPKEEVFCPKTDVSEINPGINPKI